jgi:hypothetical protein
MASFDLSQLLEGGALAGIGAAAVKALDWLRGRRRDQAEARRNEAEADVTVGAAWKGFADEMRREVDRLRARISELEQHVAARDRIIVALAHRLPMSPELRAMMLEIAPAAKPTHDQEPRA